MESPMILVLMVYMTCFLWEATEHRCSGSRLWSQTQLIASQISARWPWSNCLLFPSLSFHICVKGTIGSVEFSMAA